MRPTDKQQNVNKLFYRIGEVSRLLGVEPSVIRYWEQEFPGLRPRRSKTGQRVYSQGELKRLEEIKHLRYERGYTAAGALKVLRAKGVVMREPDDPLVVNKEKMRDSLRDIRQRIVDFIDELDRELESK